MATTIAPRIPEGFPADQVRTICQRHGISKLDLFGSRAMGEWHHDSDVDLLYELEDPFAWTFSDLEDVISEFEQLFGTKVDLVSRSGVEMSTNHYKRRAILDRCVNVYRS